MRKYIYIFILISSFGQIINGQDFGAHTIKAAGVSENIIVLTDRYIYAIDELILFKADYRNNFPNSNERWSKILFIELIKADGSPVVQEKFSLGLEGTSGKVQIPGNLFSGIYYLKAYTTWMRNYDVSSYAFKELKIINPYTSLVATSKINIGEKITLEKTELEKNNNIVLNLNKEKYKTREQVSLTLSGSEPDEVNYFISVTKKGHNESVIKLLQSTPKIEYDTARYLPEIREPYLSGKITNPATSSPEANATVSMSLLDNRSYFSSFNTNANGEFYFTFPSSEGIQDFFITAKKDDIKLGLNIDDGFCDKPVSIISKPFNLNGKEREIAQEISVNSQLHNIYKTKAKTASFNQDSTRYSFYGTPNRVVYTEKYINLPNIKEFIFELIPEFTITYKKKEPHLYTRKRNSLSNYPLLVMMDNVPISELSLFLNTNLDKIERLEIIDEGYVIGNFKYGGIINAFSKKNDIAGIELPKNSMFFSHKLPYNGDYSEYNINAVSLQGRLPDKRNCLYWNPDINLEPGIDTTITFFTSDSKGEYQVIVYTVSKETGEVSYTEKVFVVE